MKTTMDLLTAALKMKSAAAWARQLSIARTTLHSAKQRGNLSPAIAFVLADEMRMDAEAWGLIAAAESERDSACKTRMQKSLKNRLSSIKLEQLGRKP